MQDIRRNTLNEAAKRRSHPGIAWGNRLTQSGGTIVIFVTEANERGGGYWQGQQKYDVYPVEGDLK